MVYHADGRLEEAEELFRRALVGREEAAAAPQVTLTCVNNLAMLLQDVGKVPRGVFCPEPCVVSSGVEGENSRTENIEVS